MYCTERPRIAMRVNTFSDTVSAVVWYFASNCKTQQHLCKNKKVTIFFIILQQLFFFLLPSHFKNKLLNLNKLGGAVGPVVEQEVSISNSSFRREFYFYSQRYAVDGGFRYFTLTVMDTMTGSTILTMLGWIFLYTHIVIFCLFRVLLFVHGRYSLSNCLHKTTTLFRNYLLWVERSCWLQNQLRTRKLDAQLFVSAMLMSFSFYRFLLGN